MKQYLELLQDVLDNGETREDRTGTGTLSVFGKQVRYDLREGFPLVTTKKVFWKGVIVELLWFLKGGTNTKYLTDRGVHIWDAWENFEGNLGPIYGKQWRKWASGNTLGDIDQIQQAIDTIQKDPYSRRILVSAWNVTDLSAMALAPCHVMFQFYVSDKYLDLQMYQRSADLLLGVPFNIASYALLLSMIAQVTGLFPRYFIHTVGDAHIYSNHLEQVKEQLARVPRGLPKLSLNPFIDDINNFCEADIELVGYTPYPSIKAKVAV